MNLVIGMLKSSLIGLALFGVAIFGTAGTLAYWRGWAFIGAFTITSQIIGLYLAINDPALLQRRMNVGPRAETRPLQKVLISLVYVIFAALLIVSVLDYRWGWSQVSTAMSILGDGLVVLGLLVTLVVVRENSFGAATVQKMEGQTVISTGPYGIVRHPMYVGALIMMAGLPLALGSYWGLVIVLFSVPVLVVRIFDEESLLIRELDGYADYTRRVRYRLVPGLW